MLFHVKHLVILHIIYFLFNTIEYIYGPHFFVPMEKSDIVSVDNPCHNLFSVAKPVLKSFWRRSWQPHRVKKPRATAFHYCLLPFAI